MSEPIRQHYLPKMYLKSFRNDNGKIWVYNDIINAIKELSPKDTAVKTNLYTIKDNDGNKQYSIENSLAKIETLCAPIIQKLINFETINSEEKGYLSVFIATLQNRTPKSINLINEMANPILDFAYNKIAKFKQDEFIKIGNDVGLNKDLVLDLLKNSELKLTKSGEWGLLLDAAIEIAKLYSQMEWHFIYTNKSSFITTDNPILVYPALFDTKTYGNIGIAIPTVEKHLTISPNLILRIGDLGNSQIYYHELENKKEVRNINEQLFKFRNHLVIARNKEHLEYLVKRTKNKKFKTYIKLN